MDQDSAVSDDIQTLLVSSDLAACYTNESPPFLLKNGHDGFVFGCACPYEECFYIFSCDVSCAEGAYLLGGFLFWMGH